MAYNYFDDDLPADLANLDISSSKLLYNKEISGLIDTRNFTSLLSEEDLRQQMLMPDQYDYHTMEPSSSSNFLEPYDPQGYNSRSNSHSPYHELTYSENSLYPEDYSSTSSTNPYSQSEDTYGVGLQMSEVSSEIYSGYGNLLHDGIQEGAVGEYNPASPDSGAKPKQKRDRKTKEFYAKLSAEEKKQREKEKCKLRVQRFREREREKNGSLAKQLQTEEERSKTMQKQIYDLKKLQKLKKTLPPDQFNLLIQRLIDNSKTNPRQ